MKRLIVIVLMLFAVGCSTQPTKQEQDLFAAIKSDDPLQVETLLQSGIDINIKSASKHNLTPLGLTALWGKYSVAKYLIDHGADIEAKADHRFTALHLAALHRHKDIVELLLNSGANVNAIGGDNGTTPLHSALEPYMYRTINQQNDPTEVRKVTKIVKLLIEHGANVNAHMWGKVLPIHFAAMSGERTLIKLLIDNGSEIDPKGVDDVTPLYLAARTGSTDAVKLLLDSGADTNAKSASGYTPLMAASIDGDYDVVKLLVEHGSIIDSADKEGNTPLFMTLKTLLMNYTINAKTPGAEIMRNRLSINTKETKELLSKYKKQWQQVAFLLLSNNANPNISIEGDTPLRYASIVGDTKIVQTLLEHGALPNPGNKNEVESHLHAAIAEGHNDVATILVEHGADVNARNISKRPPLHFMAVYSHDTALATLLIKHGADANALDNNKMTPLDLAEKHSNKVMTVFFKQNNTH